MAAGSTYTPIATNTVTGSSVSSYTFSSIPTTYTDLILVVSAITTGSTRNLCIQVGNGSVATTGYSDTYMYGDGTSSVSGRDTNQAQMYTGRVQANPSPNIINLMNYSNTTTYKTVISRSGTDIAVGNLNVWRSTSAINTIKVFPETVDSFAVGTTLTLYGIAAA